MRIGAIFARGSCRALKWMALLGVVFMLGAGQAAAQEPAAAGRWSHAVVDDSPARTVVVAVLQGAINIKAAYARSDLFERRRRLMDDWAGYLGREPRTESRGAAGQLSLTFDSP